MARVLPRDARAEVQPGEHDIAWPVALSLDQASFNVPVPPIPSAKLADSVMYLAQRDYTPRGILGFAMTLDHSDSLANLDVALRPVEVYAQRHPRPSRVTITQAAEMLGLSRPTVRSLMKDGKLSLNGCGHIPSSKPIGS